MYSYKNDAEYEIDVKTEYITEHDKNSGMAYELMNISLTEMWIITLIRE